MPVSIVGVVTFATQSAGCEVAGARRADRCCCSTATETNCCRRQASHVVAAIAGHGDVEIIPGDGHLLAKSDDIIADRLDTWLPEVLHL